MFERKVVEKIKVHLCSIFFGNLSANEIMWKNTAEMDRPQMTLWCMRIACWITKVTDTYSEYVILISFPLQQWLHERASGLRYTYNAWLVLYPALYQVLLSSALPFIYADWNLVCICYVCCMPGSSHHSRFCQLTFITWSIQIVQLHIIRFPLVISSRLLTEVLHRVSFFLIILCSYCLNAVHSAPYRSIWTSFYISQIQQQ
jgi:hypothetical protein